MKARILSLLLPIVVATGCITTPAPQGDTLKAHYVGDRYAVELNEMVFTVALFEAPAGDTFRNLHIELNAIINPKAATGVSLYEVSDIISRLQPRLRARLVEIMPVGRPVSTQNLTNLRESLTQEARAAFDEAFSKWKHARAFDVQLVVDAFYLTDLSSGATPANRRGWW